MDTNFEIYKLYVRAVKNVPDYDTWKTQRQRKEHMNTKEQEVKIGRLVGAMLNEKRITIELGDLGAITGIVESINKDNVRLVNASISYKIDALTNILVA